MQELRQIVKEIQGILKNETIDQAEILVSMLAVEADRIFNDKRLKMKVSELEIKAEDKNAKKLIELVKNLTITEAVGILYGFDNQIKLTLKKENSKRKLSKLKIELL